MTNQNRLEGWKCPKCGNLGPFIIDAAINAKAVVFDNGTKIEDITDITWENWSYAKCPKCDLEGVVYTFTQPELDPIQWSEYINNGHSKCPRCRSDNISGDDLNINNNTVSININCNNCRFGWTDIYTLSNVQHNGEIYGRQILLALHNH